MQANSYTVSNLGSEEAEETFNNVICAQTLFLCLLSKLKPLVIHSICSGINEVKAQRRITCRSPFLQSPPSPVFQCPAEGKIHVCAFERSPAAGGAKPMENNGEKRSCRGRPLSVVFPSDRGERRTLRGKGGWGGTDGSQTQLNWLPTGNGGGADKRRACTSKQPTSWPITARIVSLSVSSLVVILSVSLSVVWDHSEDWRRASTADDTSDRNYV